MLYVVSSVPIIGQEEEKANNFNSAEFEVIPKVFTQKKV